MYELEGFVIYRHIQYLKQELDRFEVLQDLFSSFLTWSKTFLALVLLSATCVHKAKFSIWLHNCGRQSLMCHRHPNLASITIFGWNTTQLGESEKILLVFVCLRSGLTYKVHTREFEARRFLEG